MLNLSLIALVSGLTQTPCADVFENLAKQQMPVERQLAEDLNIRELAQAACETTNPDIIWQISLVETAFHFEILRFNNTSVVLKGQKALDYLKGVQVSKKPENIDIGIMQVNWYWHRQSFANDPFVMFRPAEQVRFLVTKMAPIVRKRCVKDWIGCYHNPSNGPRAAKYNEWIAGARKLLQRAAQSYVAAYPQRNVPMRNGTTMTLSVAQNFQKIALNTTQTNIRYTESSEPLVMLAKASEDEPALDGDMAGDMADAPVDDSQTLEKLRLAADNYVRHRAYKAVRHGLLANASSLNLRDFRFKDSKGSF